MIRLNRPNINTPENFNKRFNGTVGLFDIERFRKLAKYYKTGKYLDIGAFDSIMPMMLAERPGTDITVLDFANEILDFMRPRFPKVNWITHDLRNGLPFEDGHFDYVVSGEVIEHMEDPKWFIQELLRVVKKGGWLAISTPHREVERPERIGGPFHIWSYDENDMKDFLGKDVEIEQHLEGKYNTMLAWHKK